jgi:putative hydrolase of the HAD superfamily
VEKKSFISQTDIRVIGFDADDTLWVNELYFRETEKKFCALLDEYMSEHSVEKELFATEIQNLPLYGYGIKGFILSMIETALRICAPTTNPAIIEKIIEFGKELLNKPIELLDDVEHVLKSLTSKYRLVVATKGDLLDQERKLRNSGIDHYFHHVEIMSDKKESDYEKLINHLDIKPEQYLMVGNSLKSDILPVLALGGYGIHVPYHITWIHEHVDHQIENPHFMHIPKIAEILQFL